jgi:hypothetical protein
VVTILPLLRVMVSASGPSQPAGALAQRVFALLLFLAITAVAVAQYAMGSALLLVPWLAVGPLLASLVLPPRITAVLASWALLLGIGLIMDQPGRPGGLASHLGGLASHLGVLVLLAAFAVANSALRTAAQRRLSQFRAVARWRKAHYCARSRPPSPRGGWPRAMSRPLRRHGWAGTCSRSSPGQATRAGSTAIKSARPGHNTGLNLDVATYRTSRGCSCNPGTPR